MRNEAWLAACIACGPHVVYTLLFCNAISAFLFLLLLRLSISIYSFLPFLSLSIFISRFVV